MTLGDRSADDEWDETTLRNMGIRVVQDAAGLHAMTIPELIAWTRL